MGNAIIAGAGGRAGGRGGRKAKIMKMNGEFFKLSTPAKAGDVIEDYPGHVLLDSNDFLRLNLRARPLDPESELQPKKIYLLVELPRFPTEAEEDESSLRRTKSAEILNEERSQQSKNFRMSQRSVADLFVTAGSEARDGSEGGGEGPSAAAVTVKVKLPKAQVERILEQSRDDAEATEKIIDLCMEDGAKELDGAEATDVEAEERESGRGRRRESGEDETTEEVSFSKYPMNFHSISSPYTNHPFKYEKLINN